MNKYTFGLFIPSFNTKKLYLVFALVVLILIMFLLPGLIIKADSTASIIYDKDTCLPILTIKYPNKYLIQGENINKCNRKTLATKPFSQEHNGSSIHFEQKKNFIISNTEKILGKSPDIMSISFKKKGDNLFASSPQEIINENNSEYTSYITTKLGEINITYFKSSTGEKSDPYIFTSKYMIPVSYDQSNYLDTSNIKEIKAREKIGNDILSTIKLSTQNYQ